MEDKVFDGTGGALLQLQCLSPPESLLSLYAQYDLAAAVLRGNNSSGK